MTLTSVVVVAFDMARELPRTLRSLSPEYQRGVEPDAYEVIVVDNGSPKPIDGALVDHFTGQLRTARISPAPPSPARAANLGIEMSRGDLVGLMIDGARLASPGLVAHARLAATLAARPVIATLAFHLGPATHMEADRVGYDRAVEDRLLTESDWEFDGYRLFLHSALAGSSRRGWFGPLGESNGLFLPRAMWDEIGGLDERFTLPGGGLVNHDLYRRACDLPGAQLVVLLGEATFHQIHGGASTSGQVSRTEAGAEYEALRGDSYAPPSNEPVYVGRVPRTALGHLDASVQWALASRPAADGGPDLTPGA